jgi:hypothetical protein
LRDIEEEVELYFPGFKAFIDTTEQEIQRCFVAQFILDNEFILL